MTSKERMSQEELKNFWNAIKLWYLWNFKMTEVEKELFSLMVYGQSFIKNGKVIHPKKVFK